MKNILILFFILFAGHSFAQSFNDMKFSSNYSNFMIDILDYNSGYLLSGNQTDSNEATYYSTFKSSQLYINLDKNGNILDTFIQNSLDTNVWVSFTLHKDSFFYTFGSNRNIVDSAKFVVIKRDFNFNLIQKKEFSSICGPRLGFSPNFYLNDSIVVFTGAFSPINFLDKIPIYIKYNLYSMKIIDYQTFSLPFICTDFMFDKSTRNLRLFTTALYYYGRGIMLTYDSTFTLISQDTLFYNDSTAFRPIDSQLSHMKYRDSMHLISGVGAFTHNLNNPPNFYVTNPLTIQLLDSNFNIISHKAWHYDSLSIITTPWNNGLVKNANNEYFVGGHIRSIITPDIEDVILVVKVDSNLNTIWKKVLKGNGTEELIDMATTDDGGVLVLFSEFDTSITEYTIRIMNLKKIGPNGEVTSIYKQSTLYNGATISVYPNPSHGDFTIKIESKNIKNVEMLIFNSQGKLIKQEYIVLGRETTIKHINLGNVAKGFYTIHLRGNNMYRVKKLIVQ